MQAMPVVPLPMNGSNTILFSLVLIFVNLSINEIGFTVGCPWNTAKG